MAVSNNFLFTLFRWPTTPGNPNPPGNGQANNGLNGGRGNDVITGTLGNDIIHGNAGNDTLNGRTGADKVFGDTGNDLLIYDAAANAGSGLRSTLDGGYGKDTLQINLTSAQYNSPAFQADLAAYKAFAKKNSDFSNKIFHFQTIGLDVRGFENVTVVITNTAPTAHPNFMNAVEDGGAVSISAATLLANDTDPDAQDVVSIQSVSAVSAKGAAVSFNGTNVIYNPGNLFQSLGAGQTTTDTFTYIIRDLSGATSTAQVTVTITGVNDVPVTTNDNKTTAEDNSVVINVLANDSDIDLGDVLTVSAVGAAAHGTLVINPDNTLTYTPNQNFNGPDSFTYTVSDGHGGTKTGTVNITVTPVNDAPVANADNKTTAEDSPVIINVLANDFDIDLGDVLTVSSVGAAAHGTVVINSDNTLTYTPNQNFNGPDSFTYTVSDGHGGTKTGTVNITVTPVNDAPVANADNKTIAEDSPVIINVLANDSDIDLGDVLTVSAVGAAAHGTLVINPDNTLTYTPNQNFNGPDSFTYTVSDGHGGTKTGTVNITVTPVNDAPVANADTETTAEDIPVIINVLANDSDIDLGNVLTVSAVGAAAHGTVVINSDNTLTYTPNQNFNGPDSFTYTVSDGHGGTATETVNINVTPVNDAPVANADTETTAEDNSVIINVLANDSDVDLGDVLVVSAVGAAAHGTVVINSDNTLTYTPNQNFNGPDSFTYTVSDGHGGTATETVNINVTPVNDPALIAGNVFGNVTEDASAQLVTQGDLLISDVDAGENKFQIQTLTGNYGTFHVDADGHWDYSADNNQTAIQALPVNHTLTEIFTVHSLDGTDSEDVTITIYGNNDLAIIDGDFSGAVTEDDAAQLQTSGDLTVTDVDTGEAAYQAQTNFVATYGIFNLDADGHWDYSADNSQTVIQDLDDGQTLTDSFIAQTIDGDAVTVTVTINGVTEQNPIITIHDVVDVNTNAGNNGNAGTNGAAGLNAIFNNALVADRFSTPGGNGSNGTAGANAIPTALQATTIIGSNYAGLTGVYVGGANNDALSIDVSMLAARGGNGGNGGAGGVGGNGAVVANSDIASEKFYAYASNGGMGGNGANGGAGSYAKLTVGDIAHPLNLTGNEGDDVLAITALAEGGDGGNGGNGGNGGRGGNSSTYNGLRSDILGGNGSNGGNGANGGHGGDAYLTITQNNLEGGSGADTLTLQAVAVGGDRGAAGAAGSGGAAGNGAIINTTRDGVPITVSASPGLAGIAGTVGIGGDAVVTVDHNNLSGGDGHDALHIIANATAGLGGVNASVTLNNNIFDGGDGNDSFNVELKVANGSTNTYSMHDNQFIGGAGTDTLDFSNMGTAVEVDLAAGTLNLKYFPGANNTVSGIEHVIGSDFDDKLTAGTGSSILEGGDGTDLLIGNASGSETFVFAPGDDQDTINNFQVGVDKIDLRGYSAGAVGTVTISASGSNTLIDLGNGDTITLQNVQSNQVSADDFILPSNLTIPINLAINDVSITEGNSGTSVLNFTVSLSSASASAVSVTYETTDAANGTATILDADYAQIPATVLTFAPGETSKTISVTINGDTKYELDESFTVNLSAPVNAVISDNQGTGTILNDDAQPAGMPTLILNDINFNETDADYNAELVLRLSKASDTAVSVDFVVFAGAAGINTDFTTPNGEAPQTLVFAPGVTTLSVPITILGDNIKEYSESFGIFVTGANGINVTDTFLVSRINDNDPLTVNMSGPATINEPATTADAPAMANYVVTLSNPASDYVFVHYVFGDGNDVALAGVDYSQIAPSTDPAGGTLTFAPGEMSKTIQVAVVGDDLHEGNQAFTVKITGVNSGVGANLGAGTVTTTIVDDPNDINAPNDSAVVANSDFYSANEDQTITKTANTGVLQNDTNPDHNNIIAELVSGPSHASAFTFNPDGSFSITPVANYHGVDEFSYRILDGSLYSNETTVTLVFVDVNDVPVAQGDYYAVTPGSVLNVDVAHGLLINDSDADGDAVFVTNSQPSAVHGAIFIGTAGDFSYASNNDGSDIDYITYQISDGHGGLTTATITIFVNATGTVGNGIYANDDAYTVNEDNLLSVSAVGVLNNDINAFASPMSAQLVSGPNHVSNSGSFILNADGSFTYRADLNFNGTDSFTYRADDGSGTTHVATVILTVNAVNDAPVVVNDDYELNEDDSLSVTSAAAGVLGNDSDPENTGLTAALVTGPSHAASFSFNADGTFEYTPVTGFYGNDIFTYQADDGGLASSATVTITVQKINHAPENTLPPNQYTVEDVAAMQFPLESFTVAERDGDTLTTTLSVNHGVLTLGLQSGPSVTVTGTTAEINSLLAQVSYSPNPNFNGEDNLTVVTTDDGRNGEFPLLSDTDVLTIYVGAMHDAPQAEPDILITNEDTASALFNPVANDIDVDGDVLTFTQVMTNPAHGSISTVIVDGVTYLKYTPQQNYNGADSFTYKINDSSYAEAIGTVNITVNAVNDVPVANPDVASVAKNSSIIINVLSNDTDVDLDSLTISSVGTPAHGAAVISNAAIQYTPTAGYVGADSFNYTISDGKGGISTGTVSITVYPIIFTGNADTIIFDNVISSDYLAGTQYNALDGDDVITLPSNATEAAEAGFTVGTAFHGGNGNDTIAGGSLNDVMYGDDGNDVFLMDAGDDFLDGGAGSDTVSYANIVPVSGTAPFFTYYGLFVNLGTGSVIVNGPESANTVIGHDTLSNMENVIGTAYDDSISGTSAANVLDGGEGDDSLTGLGGNDTLLGGTGINSLSGGDGDDLLEGGYGTVPGTDRDIFDGGNGIDTVTYADSPVGVIVNLNTSGLQNTTGGTVGSAGNTDSLTNIENLIGSAHNDTLIGNGLNNLLNGGAGNDTLTGNSGSDTFAFDKNSNSAILEADTITDFTSGTDKLDLTAYGTSFSVLTDGIAANGEITNTSGHVQIALADNHTIDLNSLLVINSTDILF